MQKNWLKLKGFVINSKIKFISKVLFLALILSTNVSFAQPNIHKLGLLINEISFDLPSDFGEPNSIEYTFVNAGCYCSISQASTGKKERMNAIITFSFNLSELKDGRLLVSKPKDENFNMIIEDIWIIEIGTLEIQVQNTDWQSQQTKTNHFFFYVNGTAMRDQIIEFLKKTTADCGGSINEVSFVN